MKNSEFVKAALPGWIALYESRGEITMREVVPNNVYLTKLGETIHIVVNKTSFDRLIVKVNTWEPKTYKVVQISRTVVHRDKFAAMAYFLLADARIRTVHES